jgi:hypothetical protein
VLAFAVIVLHGLAFGVGPGPCVGLCSYCIAWFGPNLVDRIELVMERIVAIGLVFKLKVCRLVVPLLS